MKMTAAETKTYLMGLNLFPESVGILELCWENTVKQLMNGEQLFKMKAEENEGQAEYFREGKILLRY